MMRALPQRYGARSEEELYARTLLGAVECLRAGITTMQDFIGLDPKVLAAVEPILQAYQDAGVRVVLAPQFSDMSFAQSLPQVGQMMPAELREELGLCAAANTHELLNSVDNFLSHRSDLLSWEKLNWALATSGPERSTDDFLAQLHQRATVEGLHFFSHVAITRSEAHSA